MLQAPAYTEIEGVTLFQDDALFYKFYPIASAPRIRLDENGKPVFLLVKYALSDEDRQKDPDMPAGGGYLNFDIQFDVPPEKLEKIRKQLQADVDTRWQRFKTGSEEEQDLHGVAGTTEPPTVEFGSPTWTGGKTVIEAPQSEELVSARVAEGEPSLLSGNIGVFNMDLTPAGATFMQKTLVAADGQGASDLTPIQVGYELKFWARLPDVRIHVHADSEKLYQYTRQIMDGRGVDYCTTYDFEHTDIASESIEMSGAMEIQIDTGSGSLPEEVIADLRQYSLDLVKQMVAASFFTDQPAAQPDDPVPSSGDSEDSRKYLKQDFDHTTANIEFNLEQRSVIEWTIYPQTTLETFFHGMPAEEIKQYVREFELNDPFYQNLSLTARAFSDFEDQEISNVEVQVYYAGTDENGENQEKDHTFTFVDNSPQSWTVSLIGGQREYQYRYRVSYQGREAGPFSEWTRTTSNQLNIPAINAGRVKMDVLAGNLDFENLVSQVQVHLAYEDLELGVGREEAILLLSPKSQEAHYERLIYMPQRRPVQYRTTYILKSGEMQPDGGWQDTPGAYLLVNQPFNNLLQVSLLPTGDGWDDVVQVHVNLKYADPGNEYTVEDSLTLQGLEEFKTWKVYLKNKDLRSYQYQWVASYKNGGFEQREWMNGQGNDTLPIPIARQGIRVSILPDLLDLAAAPQTEATFHYSADGVSAAETFAFRDKTPQAWYIKAPDGAPVDFTYQVTHYPASSDPVILPEVREQDTVVILPPYRPPKAGQLIVPVIGMLVDFAFTPLVAVDLAYEEPDGTRQVGGLTLTADDIEGTWTIDIQDVRRKQFSYQVTYYTADGVGHPQPAQLQEVPRVIVPSFNTA